MLKGNWTGACTNAFDRAEHMRRNTSKITPTATSQRILSKRGRAVNGDTLAIIGQRIIDSVISTEADSINGNLPGRAFTLASCRIENTAITSAITTLALTHALIEDGVLEETWPLAAHVILLASASVLVIHETRLAREGELFATLLRIALVAMTFPRCASAMFTATIPTRTRCDIAGWTRIIEERAHFRDTSASGTVEILNKTIWALFRNTYTAIDISVEILARRAIATTQLCIKEIGCTLNRGEGTHRGNALAEISVKHITHLAGTLLHTEILHTARSQGQAIVKVVADVTYATASALILPAVNTTIARNTHDRDSTTHASLIIEAKRTINNDGRITNTSVKCV